MSRAQLDNAVLAQGETMPWRAVTDDEIDAVAAIAETVRHKRRPGRNDNEQVFRYCILQTMKLSAEGAPIAQQSAWNLAKTYLRIDDRETPLYFRRWRAFLQVWHQMLSEYLSATIN